MSIVPAVQLAAVVDGMAVGTSQAMVEGSRKGDGAAASQDHATVSDRPAPVDARQRTTREASVLTTTVPVPASRVSASLATPTSPRATGKSGAQGGRRTRSSGGEDDFGSDDALIDALAGRLVMDLRAVQALREEASVPPVAAISIVAPVTVRVDGLAPVHQAVAAQDQASAEQVFAGAHLGALGVPVKGRPAAVASTTMTTPGGTHDARGIGVGGGHGGASGGSPQEEGASTGLLADLTDSMDRDGADRWPAPDGLYQPPLMNRRLETNGVDDALILLVAAMMALRARSLPGHEVPAPMPARLPTSSLCPKEPEAAPSDPALPVITRRRDAHIANRTWRQAAQCARWPHPVGTAASCFARAQARRIHQLLHLSDLGPRPRVECAVFWVPAERPPPKRLQRVRCRSVRAGAGACVAGDTPQRVLFGSMGIMARGNRIFRSPDKDKKLYNVSYVK